MKDGNEGDPERERMNQTRTNPTDDNDRGRIVGANGDESVGARTDKADK